ncbi:RNA-directed RNA polymerase, partial [ssRNA phage SRR6960799_17]
MSQCDKDELARQWLKEKTVDETILFAKKLADIFLKRVGDEGAALDQAINAGDWLSVLDYSPDAVRLTAEPFYALAQAQACFSKLECLPTGIDKRAAAYKKFLDGEYRCGIFNRIFEKRSAGLYKFSARTEAILHASARKIERYLGPCPEIQDVPIRYTVGGATTTIKKKDADLRNLIAGSFHMSKDTAADGSRLAELLASLPHLLSNFEDAEGVASLQVASGVLNFVRKNAKAYRGVTNEPDLTKLIQTAYGDVIRDRIKRVGIDLTDDGRQKELARIGSITGGIATLDLSNASGLISTGLVLDQFPEPWLDIFFWARTREIYIPFNGETRVLQAYAGMGNGITFPLESVLFHCLAESCCEYEGIRFPITSVYGDDIIVSVEAAECVMEVFEEIGLKINFDKSFWSGPFRESCGSDWLSGYDVRPIFVRDVLTYELLYSLYNQFASKGDEEVCQFILSNIPEELQLWGPPGRGDGHLHTDDWRNFAKFAGDSSGMSHWSYQSINLEPKVRFVVTAHDHLVPLVFAHASDKKKMLEKSVTAFLRQTGRTWTMPSTFYHWHRTLQKCGVPPGAWTSGLVAELRDFALEFEALSAELPQQTERHRKRRGWKLRYQGVSKPDTGLAVFGTPLPGSRSTRITTS